jgi:gas vesicle protein
MRTGNYESSDKSTAGTAVTFLLIGLGAGALVALLLAPKTGKQMRRDLRRKYDDVRETVEDFAEEAKERVNDVMERGSEWVDTARERMDPIGRAVRKR